MVMEMHNVPGHDMDRFIMEMPIFSMIDDRKVIYLYFFAFNFSSNMLNFFQCALAFAIERKITLVGDICFRPPIVIRVQDLHLGDIRRVVDEITSYHNKD